VQEPAQRAKACSPGQVRAALGTAARRLASPRSGRKRVAQGTVTIHRYPWLRGLALG